MNPFRRGTTGRTRGSRDGRRTAYVRLAARLRKERGRDEGMQQAVGGDFEAVGRLERDLIIACGLPRDGMLVDVGCGSGRLARQLVPWFEGDYVGTDVVSEMLDYAREQVPDRPGWRFERVEGLTIPVPDASADVVCFFSVFTHLLHEETYRYLQEALRVLKPGGVVVFSFLEFRMPSHWVVFDSMVADLNHVHNQFLDRDAIEAFAEHLGLALDAFHDGETPHIPLSEPVRWDNGQVMEGLGHLGQSVCVLRRS